MESARFDSRAVPDGLIQPGKFPRVSASNAMRAGREIETGFYAVVSASS